MFFKFLLTLFVTAFLVSLAFNICLNVVDLISVLPKVIAAFDPSNSSKRETLTISPTCISVGGEGMHNF